MKGMHGQHDGIPPIDTKNWNSTILLNGHYILKKQLIKNCKDVCEEPKNCEEPGWFIYLSKQEIPDFI